MPTAEILLKWFALVATAASLLLLAGLVAVSCGMWATVAPSLGQTWPGYLIFILTPVIQIVVLRARHFSQGRRQMLGRIVVLALLPLEILLVKLFLRA